MLKRRSRVSMSGRMEKKREGRADQPVDVQAIQEKNDHEINEHILRIIDTKNGYFL